MFLAAAPVPVPAGAAVTVRLRHQSGFGDHNVGRFRLSTTPLEPSLVKLDGGSGLPGNLLAIVTGDPAKRSEADRKALESGSVPTRITPRSGPAPPSMPRRRNAPRSSSPSRASW